MLDPLQENKSLRYLDLSGNILNTKNKLVKPQDLQEQLEKFNEIINVFIETDKKSLIHLDLSNMVDGVGTKLDKEGNGET